MVKSFLNWLGAWLLATLFVFLAFMAVSAFIGFCWTAAPDWDDTW